jgi:S1-C subfamily serine protease
MDRDNDIVLLKVDGSGFSYLKTGNSDELLTGETIYTISSPSGAEQLILPGEHCKEFANVRRRDVHTDHRSHLAGSSGGALLNTKGQVIGSQPLRLQAGRI